MKLWQKCVIGALLLPVLIIYASLMIDLLHWCHVPVVVIILGGCIFLFASLVWWLES